MIETGVGDWATEGVYEFLGTRVRVASSHHGIGEVIDGLFANFRVPDPAAPPTEVVTVTEGDGGFDVYRGDRRYRRDLPAEKAVSRLLNLLNLITVEGLEFPAFHAGAVADSGRVIAFPGRSGIGKTTLTAACALDGFDYVTDEALCLEPDTGEVIPYPKPFWLSPTSRSLLGLHSLPMVLGSDKHKAGMTTEQLGVRVAQPPLFLSEVVLADLEPSASASLTEVSQSEVAVRLLETRFLRGRHPVAAFRLASSTARSARGWRLVFGDLKEAVALLSDRFRLR